MSDEQPIIIKKVRKGGHGGHHGGSWKVAFADFMTAMMAFFLVMWLVGQEDRVKEAVAGYFRDPGRFEETGGKGALKGSPGIMPTEGSKASPVKPVIEKEHLPSEEEVKLLKSAAKKIAEELQKQKAFEKLKKNVKLQMTSEGLRIILNENEDSPAFFEPGSAKLLQKSAVVLMTIAKELGQLENRLVIEGHTDASKSDAKDYGNWELSADRANSARQLMEVSGLKRNQVREVRGYADEFPMIEQNPTDPRNRRVTILVVYKSRETAYEKMEVGTDLMREIGG